jgi:hypothetical protein
MNEQTKQHLAVGQDVTYVGPDKQNHKGKITTIYSENAARIEWQNGSAVATFSDKGEEGTFHFEQASHKAETKK